MKNEPGDSSRDVYVKALDYGFLVEVASYHVSGVAYRTAEDHAEHHAKDLKWEGARVNDLRTTKTDGKRSRQPVCLTHVNK